MANLLSEIEMAMWRIDNKDADYARMMSVGFLRTHHAEIAAAVRDAEVLRHERDHARRQYERSVQILVGIHNLLYPQRHTNAQGVTFQFHSPLVHEQMQALSDRIRAIPDEIAAMSAQEGQG